MTRDLDTLLRDADPLRGEPGDDAARLAALRERVDRERDGRGGDGPTLRRDWRRRAALVAVAAAALTAVPVVAGIVGGDDDGGPPLITPAVAEDGSIICGAGYTTAVPLEESAVRLLPDELPAGWSYTRIYARHDVAGTSCVPPSLTALRLDPQGVVTGRVSVTGPVDAHVDQGRLLGSSVPDTVLGQAARRFDVEVEHPVQHWVWTDVQGRQWSVEASGMPLDEARQVVAAASVDGDDVGWDAAAAPGWTLVQQRREAPYGVAGRLSWSADLTDGSQQRVLQVWDPEGPVVPLLASTGIGEQVTTLDGLPAVVGRPRGDTTPVLVEVAPGTVAMSFWTGTDRAEVERMLTSLRQAIPDDPRLERYGIG
ncbi:hypothetical protein ACI8AF_01830 [Blastococcus sp. SYSU D00669]